jgi:uncharacterized membrane protein
MAQETWLVVAVAAGFLLLGIAASPLGWVAILHRRTRSDRESERSMRELRAQLRSLQGRLERCEAAMQARREEGGAVELFASKGLRAARGPGRAVRPADGRVAGAALDGLAEPKLIAVPNLSAAHDRQAMHNGLSQRYAAIWDLADAGASPDVIARATGQPIGQIERILGLRRQYDASRTNIPHASHE